MVDRVAVGKKSKSRGNQFINIEGKTLPLYEFDQLVNKTFGFIYITENMINHKYYVGLHYKWNRNYLGSGHYLVPDIKKYGKENFNRYIIDFAQSKSELEELESFYIQEYFGFDCAESSDFYNITSGLQRGGDTWRGMTEEDRKIRSKRISQASIKRRKSMTEEDKKQESELHMKAAVRAYKNNPDYRKHVSEGTKRGMTSEVRQHISDVQRGVPHPFKSAETRKKAQNHMKLVGRSNIGNTPWNKGMKYPSEKRAEMVEKRAKYYEIKQNGKQLAIIKSHDTLDLAQKIGKLFDKDTFGRNTAARLIKEGTPFIPQTKAKEVFRNLTIKEVTDDR